LIKRFYIYNVTTLKTDLFDPSKIKMSKIQLKLS